MSRKREGERRGEVGALLRLALVAAAGASVLSRAHPLIVSFFRTQTEGGDGAASAGEAPSMDKLDDVRCCYRAAPGGAATWFSRAERGAALRVVYGDVV